ncbi:NAD(P)-dependent oxidoreductase [Labrenzia sp. OB1]|uniref:NAD(P)-dependent oxidoreductase n=1 Tax=Labrenzia sp. OB1 TaxID=1561204 RepID=UPI000838EA57|nr:NAD(P)-dependent oxidoreductase [Labrenzia sp. OB1]
MKVAIIGIGAMGLAMAGHIASAGFEVVAHDLDEAAMDAARAAGLKTADRPAGLKGADVVLVMVATDGQSVSAVESLLDGILTPGATIVVTATNHPETMIDLAGRCSTAGIDFVDAPVCYGLQGAKTGELVSLCGGPKDSIDRVTPVLSAYSRSVEHIGDHGAGQVAKTCNNMMHWAACVANYETLALARAWGLDAQAMRETLLKCPARNTTLERWDTTRFTWHEKDMDVALGLAQETGLPLPLFGLVDQLVKRLGPDDVRQLLHEPEAGYLGAPIQSRSGPSPDKAG